MNTPVLVDWLSVTLGPVAVIALIVTLVVQQSAKRRGEPMPGWGTGVRLAACGCVLLIAILHLAVGT